MMKIALSGASGSGKTTLVHYIADKYPLKWLDGSSGQLKTLEEIKCLEHIGLTSGKGHMEVIRSGHKNPRAAILNQELILTSRTELIKKNEDFVTDRSPLDNWVYYLLQCAMYQNDMQTEEFKKNCYYAAQELTHLIFVPTMFKIEENGSRITNMYYQQMVTSVFRAAFEEMRDQACLEGWSTKFHCVVQSNLALRKDVIDEFLTEQ